MTCPGSDCVTGKRQFATREAAAESARLLRRDERRSTAYAFRCGWCDCWHVGNRRADNSKSRAARRR